MLMQTSIKHVKVLNSRGFTLAEVLLSFSIFCLIVSFLPVIVPILIHQHPIEMRIQRLEWEIFISQIKKEIRMSQNISVSSQRLQLERDGQLIIYEKYGANLRRRVDNKGHEILLQQVHSFQFERLLNGVSVSVTDLYGNQYREAVPVLIRDVVY